MKVSLLPQTFLLLLVVLTTTTTTTAFQPSYYYTVGRLVTPHSSSTTLKNPQPNTNKRRTTTELRVLLDVPDGFFTITFPMLGILLSISKNFARLRMEERAWEQRLEEGRNRLLQQNPTLSELDLLRKEASMEWSAYGKPRMMEEELKRKQQQQYDREDDNDDEFDTGRRSRRSRVKVKHQQEEKDTVTSTKGMSEEEINEFELEYGITYDPYYDEPYTEEELPDGKYTLDKIYGDRIYENGEVFYKDNNNNVYYRQGAKPRNSNSFTFWN